MRATSFDFRTRVIAAALGLLAWDPPVSGGEPGPAVAPANRPANTGVVSMLLANQLDEPIEADTAPVEVKNGVLELRGPINAGMQRRFDDALAMGDITTVRITSQGGNIVDAMEIASKIQARGIEVVVHDLCAGACAQYIFIAGSKRRLENRSLVGFMYSFKSMGTMMAMASNLMWVPSREYLKAAGVDFEGDWPKSHFTMGGLAFTHLKAGISRIIRYGDNDHRRSKKQKPYSREDLRKCVMDKLPDEPGAPAG